MTRIDEVTTGFYAVRKRLERLDPEGAKAAAGLPKGAYATAAGTQNELVKAANDHEERIRALEAQGGAAPFPG